MSGFMDKTMTMSAMRAQLSLGVLFPPTSIGLTIIITKRQPWNVQSLRRLTGLWAVAALLYLVYRILMANN